ncbi:MAG: hypothetical protein V4726_10500 [Verrucomicrobiota bacterium]
MKLPAVLLFLASFASAPAEVIYSGLRNISIPDTVEGVTLDVDAGAIVAEAAAGWDINIFLGGFGIAGSAAFQPARTGTENQDPVRRFDADILIVPMLLYSAGETGSIDHLGAAGNFQEGQPGYLGFRFTKNGGGDPLYGWMRVTLTANSTTGVIHDWAWENSGGGIPTGQVPEPSSRLSLLAAGLGILLQRRGRPHRPGCGDPA